MGKNPPCPKTERERDEARAQVAALQDQLERKDQALATWQHRALRAEKDGLEALNQAQAQLAAEREARETDAEERDGLDNALGDVYEFIRRQGLWDAFLAEDASAIDHTAVARAEAAEKRCTELEEAKNKLADFIEARIQGSEVFRDTGTVVT